MAKILALGEMASALKSGQGLRIIDVLAVPAGLS